MAPTALDLSLGAIEMGVLISSVFYGNLVVQCYIYSQSSIKDRLWIKLLVSFILLLETLHTVFIWMYLYEISVTNYGHPAALDGLPWHVDVSLMLQGFVGSAVQAFFSYRAWIVSGKIWLAIPGWIGELVRAGVSIALTVVTLTTPGLTVFREKYEWMGIFTCVLAATIDVWNTVILCYYLRALQSNMRFHRTTQIINKLTMWSIETGLFTSIVAILLVIFLIGQQENALWIGVLIIYAKVYSNSLLVSLNAREKIREMDQAPQTTGGAIITIGSAPTPSTEGTLDLELSRIRRGEAKHRPQAPIITTDVEYHESGVDHDLTKRPSEW